MWWGGKGGPRIQSVIMSRIPRAHHTPSQRTAPPPSSNLSSEISQSLALMDGSWRVLAASRTGGRRHSKAVVRHSMRCAVGKMNLPLAVRAARRLGHSG